MVVSVLCQASSRLPWRLSSRASSSSASRHACIPRGWILKYRQRVVSVRGCPSRRQRHRPCPTEVVDPPPILRSDDSRVRRTVGARPSARWGPPNAPGPIVHENGARSSPHGPSQRSNGVPQVGWGVRRNSVATPDRDLKTALPRCRSHSIRLLDLLGGRLDQVRIKAGSQPDHAFPETDGYARAQEDTSRAAMKFRRTHWAPGGYVEDTARPWFGTVRQIPGPFRYLLNQTPRVRLSQRCSRW